MINSGSAASVNKNVPMINSLTSTLNPYLSAPGQLAKKKALMKWLKNIPELTALISKVARDVVSKYHFEPINSGDTGRNKIMRANKFSTENSLKKIMYSQVVDTLALGEGFGWKGSISEEQIKEKISQLVKKEKLSQIEQKSLVNELFSSIIRESKNFNNGFYLEVKSEDGIGTGRFSDEDLLRPRKYRHIASSTMEVLHDQYDIIKYRQSVGLNTQDFSPEEIIRFVFTELDGRIGGFTPVESIVVQLELLRQMWQNMLSIHKNGGSPDKLFILENTKVNSPEYQRIKQQLEKYKIVENKHGNMVFTGKVSVEDLTQLDKMQFMDSGLYITGLVAMQWQIPRSSIPYIIGGANTKDDTGGNSDAGYWSTIEYFQEIYAETMNAQLWIPHFGVKICFDNNHIQRKIREETEHQLVLGNISTMQNLLRGAGKQLKEEKMLRLLDLQQEDVEEAEMELVQNPSTLNNQLDKQTVNSDQDKSNIRARKKNEQTNIAQSTGQKPNGVTKEFYDFYQE